MAAVAAAAASSQPATAWRICTCKRSGSTGWPRKRAKNVDQWNGTAAMMPSPPQPSPAAEAVLLLLSIVMTPSRVARPAAGGTKPIPVCPPSVLLKPPGRRQPPCPYCPLTLGILSEVATAAAASSH
ncbi:hypothetical protein Vretimale_12790, partial [Volvox reticuliferus]